MSFPFNFWSILFGIGALQGFFLGLTLLSMRRKGQGEYSFLALAVLSVTYILAMYTLRYSQVIVSVPHFLGTSLAMPTLVGPAFYFYVRSLQYTEAGIRRKDWLHFVPFILLILFFVPQYLLPGSEKLAAFDSPALQWKFGLSAYGKAIHLLIYLTLTVRMVSRYLATSTQREPGLRWLRGLLYVFIADSVVGITLFTLRLVGVELTLSSDQVELTFLALGTYLMAFLIIKYPPSISLTSDPPVQKEQAPAYRTSPLTPEQKQVYLQSLLAYMEAEKPYTNSTLRLEELASQIDLPAHHLTEVLNQELKKNFADFVNGYRVEEVKRKMLDPEEANKTILALALDSGFNSKSSFNRIFRKHTGMSPSAYKAQAQQAE